MQLSEDLVQRIEVALDPINGETADNVPLGRAGRIAMSTLNACRTTKEILSSAIGRNDGRHPQTVGRAVGVAEAALNQEVVWLERRLRELSKRTDRSEGFDPAALAGLADEVKQIIGPQSKGRS